MAIEIIICFNAPMKTINRSIFCALFTLFFSFNSYSVDEQDMPLIYDLLNSNAYQYGGITGVAGIELNYLKYGEQGDKGAVVISPGRSEATIKYLELAYDLGLQGYGPIYVSSDRGQGLSERMLSNPRKGYVRHFYSYSRDLNTFMNQVVVPENRFKRLYLIAHSMGGAAAAIYLQNFKSHFHKVVLTAPMLQLDLGDNSERSVLIQTAFVCKVPFGPYCTDYIPGGSDREIRDTFEENEVTSSRVRFNFQEDFLRRWPELKFGSPTYRWLREALVATRKLRHENAIARIQTPILLLQAQKDTVVKNFGQNQFCERTPFCELTVMEDAKHEIFSERDEIRKKALNLVTNFLK